MIVRNYAYLIMQYNPMLTENMRWKMLASKMLPFSISFKSENASDDLIVIFPDQYLLTIILEVDRRSRVSASIFTSGRSHQYLWSVELQARH